MATAVPVARGRTSMSTRRGGHEANMGIMSTTRTTRTTGTSTPSTRVTMTTTEEAAIGGTATEDTTAEVVGRAAAVSRKAARAESSQEARADCEGQVTACLLRQEAR